MSGILKQVVILTKHDALCIKGAVGCELINRKRLKENNNTNVKKLIK